MSSSKVPPGPPQQQAPGTRMVFCVKLQREMPGLDEPPFDTPLGQRVYESISREAWRMWSDYAKMVLNEYRLNAANPRDQEVLVKHMEEFFFGENAALPPSYVPPKT